MIRYVNQDNKVIDLNMSRPKAALERLNRLTGLKFQQLPESLVNTSDDDKASLSIYPKLANS